MKLDAYNIDLRALLDLVTETAGKHSRTTGDMLIDLRVLQTGREEDIDDVLGDLEQSGLVKREGDRWYIAGTVPETLLPVSEKSAEELGAERSTWKPLPTAQEALEATIDALDEERYQHDCQYCADCASCSHSRCRHDETMQEGGKGKKPCMARRNGVKCSCEDFTEASLEGGNQ